MSRTLGRPVVSAFALWLVVLPLLALPATAQAAGAYVANFLSDNVSQYAIGAGGELSSLSPATVATGGGPVGVALTPDGKSAYVTNNDSHFGAFGVTVSQYNVDPPSCTPSPTTP